MKTQTVCKFTRFKILVLFTAFILGSAALLSSCTSPEQEAGIETPAPIYVPPHEVAPKRYNSEASMAKPYVVLVSIDGFRHDYIEKYGAKNLADIEKHGRRAEGLVPSFPTKTFPNHYTIVTGMLPTAHGIVDNKFYDPKLNKYYDMTKTAAEGNWYGGEPLWTVAERSNMLAASYFWVGSEAEIKGFRPSYWYPYLHTQDNKSRVDQIAKWLALPEAERPHMLTLYFALVDDAGHKFGPDAKETGDAVREADDLIGLLRTEIAATKLPINLIVVSDHGMGYLDPTKTVALDKLADFKNFDMSGSGTFISLFPKAGADLAATYKSLKTAPNTQTFLRANIPASYKISGERIGEIVIMADDGYYMMTRPITDPSKPSGNMATHGWATTMKDMQGLFVAEGPNIAVGARLQPFDNIHIYPLILKILGLQTAEKIDGRIEVLEPIYKQ